VFVADHYFQPLRSTSITKNVIRITFTHHDLLLLSSVCFLRAGDANIDNNLLEYGTYQKLKDTLYHASIIDDINRAYPFVGLSDQSPNCPRYILREFFKFGFRDVGTHGLTKELDKMVYDTTHRVFDFPFDCFYHTQKFIDKMNDLAAWCETFISDSDQVMRLHQKFLDRQIYRFDKIQADEIIEAVCKRRIRSIPRLRLLQESYINGRLEHIFGLEMPFKQQRYFTSTDEISHYLDNTNITAT